MPELIPEIALELSYIPITDGVQISPPLYFQAVAVQYAQESGTGIDGRYIPATGEIHGPATPKLQDTYIEGTAGMTGRSFDVISGTWRDDWVSAWSGTKYGLMMPDGSDGAGYEIKDHTPNTAGLQHALVIIRRGIAPPTTGHTPANCYAYLELASGATSGNYRIALEWGQPIRLDYQEPSSTTWSAVAIARDLGNVESYLAHNNHEIRLHILPDNLRMMMVVEIGDGHFLRHTPKRGERTTLALPETECYRLTGQNGWLTFEVYPLRYGPAVIKKAPAALGETPPNMDATRIAANGASPDDPDRTVSGSASVNGDGELEWEATAENPDAGDGLGSATPPTIAGIDVVIPAVWGYTVGLGIPSGDPPASMVHEVEVWDDVTRTFTSTHKTTCSNQTGWASGAWGNYAYLLSASNGGPWGVRSRGVIAGPPGIVTRRQDPVRLAELVGHDMSWKLFRPLGQRLILDGWCIYAAVRTVLEIGQIAPPFMSTIPYWPAGPAGYDCPYPILGRGTGLNALYNYDPGRSCISVLLELVADAGFVTTYGQNLPYYTGSDPSGQFRFEPWDPRMLSPVKWYSDRAEDTNRILDISVYSSVDHMRTDIDFQGQDPFTYELLHYHLPMPWNLYTVGYRYPWFERNNRWSSMAYLASLGRSAAILGSMPQQVVNMMVPFDPTVHAGQLVWIEEAKALKRVGLFVITMLDSRYGMRDPAGSSGYRDCYSFVTARAAENMLAV